MVWDKVEQQKTRWSIIERLPRISGLHEGWKKSSRERFLLRFFAAPGLKDAPLVIRFFYQIFIIMPSIFSYCVTAGDRPKRVFWIISFRRTVFLEQI